MVVASSEDEYAPFERSKRFASAWGSEFVNIGAAGHINAASGYGPWPEGLRMLKDFVQRISKEQGSGTTA
jgi:predicted alpha/beta hydrolase family esterase